FAFGLLWGGLVAISRVVLGAHFLSDVIAGFYVTLVSAYGYYRLLFRK
ncbi:MAG: phosphatase PAP2 family protein, partial [Clostridiales bacterium]|nr:phosphatase PAP2 family protein [Clostridiales bacterium]